MCCVLLAQHSVQLVARKAKHWQIEAGANFRPGLRWFIAALISVHCDSTADIGGFELCLWLLAPIVREAINAFKVWLGWVESIWNAQPQGLFGILRFHQKLTSVKCVINFKIIAFQLGLSLSIRMELQMIRIYRVALVFRFFRDAFIAQHSVQLVARKTKHWQHEAGANFRPGLRWFIAALISVHCDSTADSVNPFVRNFGA